MKAGVDLNIHLDKFFLLYSDCIPVAGAKRFALYDLTRNEIILLPIQYFEILQSINGKRVSTVIEGIKHQQKLELVVKFIEYLFSNEYLFFVDNITSFPEINEKWDIPAVIQNAIIDVDFKIHDFKRIFRELEVLGCQFIQIRSFSKLLTLDCLKTIISEVYHKSFKGIELIIKYDYAYNIDDYVNLLETFPIISDLIIHSSPETHEVSVNFGCGGIVGRYIEKIIKFTNQKIGSASHCGNISIKSLNAPSFNNFFEFKNFNGCLNRKISIDANGRIKNCPSIREDYGDISNTTLQSAINTSQFSYLGSINKDQIDICKNCEFRYACSDCRAYIDQPDNIFSKPLKCGYNPFESNWQDWSINPLKEKVIKFYQVERDGINL